GAIERNLWIDRDGTLLFDDRLLSEGRRVGELERRLAVDNERHRVLRARRVAAFRRPSDLACLTATTMRQRRQQDGIALAHRRDARAHSLDNAGAFVTEDDGNRVGDRSVDD